MKHERQLKTYASVDFDSSVCVVGCSTFSSSSDSSPDSIARASNAVLDAKKERTCGALLLMIDLKRKWPGYEEK